ncbi:MAG: hypothetical protein JHC95_09880 [Solirubrobacteraceae bacterium]|nr:hypothetical protein [Solirubrobacteraceae bacterium]
MSTALWIEQVEVPDKPTAADARAFFGVPPDPESALDKNIAKKRRTWRAKVRGRKTTPEVERQINLVVELITQLADYVKRGTEEPLDLDELREVFNQKPETVVDELEDLWRVVEELLAAGQMAEALKVANEARERFEDAPVADAVFGWVAAQASRSASEEATERLRVRGLEALERAMATGEIGAELYEARVTLQLDLGRDKEALGGLDEAVRVLGDEITPMLRAARVEVLVATGSVRDAASAAVEAVRSAPDDLSIRSTTVEALITAMRRSLLPISDAEGLARYQLVADVAAWCAHGAPEAEDMVRPFRMWAVVAENRMFAGDIGFRAFVGVASGFLLLPLLNRFRSKPQWWILNEGPGCIGDEVFIEVAMGAVSRTVHDGITDRLPWWEGFQQDLQERHREAA